MNDKETLEEAAERLTKDFPHYSVRGNMEDSDIKGWFLEALQKGAKWQAEKMYSEEEVKEQLNLILAMKNSLLDTFTDDNGFITEKWFEQFKKKQVMTAIELLKSTTEYEVLESFRNKVAKLEEKAQMYSEEEVGELLYNVIGEYGKHYGIMIDGKMLNDLFEQFKKK